MDRMNNKVKGLGSSFKSTLGGIAGGFILGNIVQGVAREVGGLVDGALDFGAAMANVNSIAQLSTGQLNDLSAQVNSLAGETAQAPQVLAEGLYSIYSSGFQGAAAIDVLTASANAATAGLTTTDVAARAITATMNAYGQETYTASQISDVLFQTVNDGVISFEQLANNLGNTLPMANALGISVQELGAAYAQMTLKGVSASQAETQIASLMRSAANPTEALTAAMVANGEATAQSMIANQGLEGFLKAVYVAADGNQEVMYDLLGTQEAVNAATILGADGAKAYATEVDKMTGASKGAGATNKALAKQMESASFRMKQARIAVQQAAVVFIGALSPAIAVAAQGFTWLVMHGLIPMTEAMAGVIGKGGQFIGFLRDAFGAGAHVSDILAKIFGDKALGGPAMGSMLTQTGGRLRELAQSMLLLADSAGHIFRAFQEGGLSGALDEFRNQWERIKGELGDIAHLALDIVIDTGISVIGDILDVAGDLWGWIQRRYLGSDILGISAGLGTGGAAGMKPITFDVLVDGAIKLIGDLNDIGGSISRELGLQVTAGDLEEAHASGQEEGKKLGDAIGRGIQSGIDLGVSALSGGEGGGDGSGGIWSGIKKILNFDLSGGMFKDQEPIIFDLWYAKASGWGAGVRQSIEEGFAAGLESPGAGIPILGGMMPGLDEGPLHEFINKYTNVTGALDALADEIKASFDHFIEVITPNIDVGMPQLPSWVQNPLEFLQPIIGFASKLTAIATVIDTAKDALDSALGRASKAPPPPGAAGFTGALPSPGLGAGGAGGGIGTGFPVDPSTLIQEFTTTWKLDKSDVESGLAAVGPRVSEFAAQTFKGTLDLNPQPAIAAVSGVTAIATTFAAQTFKGTLDFNAQPAIASISGVTALANTFDGSVYTASLNFAVDTSGLAVAEAAARQTAQVISDLLHHASPPRKGPLHDRPAQFDSIGADFADVMGRMRGDADRGMSAVADRLNRRMGVDLAGSGAYANGAGAGGVQIGGPQLHFHGAVYNKDEIHDKIVDTYTDHIVPAIEIAMRRRDRSMGLNG